MQICYHSHEVFNFGLLDPLLPLLLDLLDGEQAGSLVGLEDGAGHQGADLLHPGEGGRVDEGSAAERVVLVSGGLGQALHALLLLDGHRVRTTSLRNVAHPPCLTCACPLQSWDKSQS